MQEGLRKSLDALTELIGEYESDTFSAEGEGLTREEAETIAYSLAERAVMDLINLNSLDGLTIGEELDALRD